MSPAELGAILPETDGAGAYDVISPVLDAALHATFTVRGQGSERRNFSDVADVHVGLASYAGRYADAEALLKAARAVPIEALSA